MSDGDPDEVSCVFSATPGPVGGNFRPRGRPSRHLCPRQWHLPILAHLCPATLGSCLPNFQTFPQLSTEVSRRMIVRSVTVCTKNEMMAGVQRCCFQLFCKIAVKPAKFDQICVKSVKRLCCNLFTRILHVKQACELYTKLSTLSTISHRAFSTSPQKVHEVEPGGIWYNGGWKETLLEVLNDASLCCCPGRW